MSGGLLLNERCVMAQPSLVRVLGLMQAVVLQQLHWHLNVAEHWQEYEGERWHAVTESELADEMGLSRDQVKRTLLALEERGVVLTVQPEGWATRRKWYRIDLDHDLIHCAESPNRKGQNRPIPMGGIAHSPSLDVEELQESAADAATPLTLIADAVVPRESRKRNRARSKRDDVFDALARAFKIATPTKSERTALGAVAAELAEVGAEPAEVDARLARYRELHPTWDATPRALAKHWSSCVPSTEPVNMHQAARLADQRRREGAAR